MAVGGGVRSHDTDGEISFAYTAVPVDRRRWGVEVLLYSLMQRPLCATDIFGLARVAYDTVDAVLLVTQVRLHVAVRCSALLFLVPATQQGPQVPVFAVDAHWELGCSEHSLYRLVNCFIDVRKFEVACHLVIILNDNLATSPRIF